MYFNKFTFEQPQPSVHYKWPTKEDQSLYKINGFWLELGQSYTNIERQTYSILELVGDAGGLFDGLRLIGHFFMAPFAAFTMKTRLLSLFFRLVQNRV